MADLLPIIIMTTLPLDSAELEHQCPVVVLVADIKPKRSDAIAVMEALDDVLVMRDGFLGLQKPKEEFTTVARNAVVTALVRDISTGARGRRVRFTNLDGDDDELEMLDADFHQNQAALLAQLAGRGLFISPTAEAKRLLLEHLLRQEPRERFLTCAPGWVELDGHRAYALATGTAGPVSIAGHLEVRTGATASAKYTLKGEPRDWRDQVGVLCRGNSRLLFGTSLAFSAILLPHTDQEGGGAHFYGGSSSGKSTLLMLIASVFGSSVHQWRSTPNAMEGLAAAHNHQVLIMDELGQLEPKSAATVIYMLANGSGKHRATKGGDGRRPAQWKLQVTSAGEVSFAEHAAQADQKLKPGQELRMLDIEAEVEGGHGVFEELHGFSDGAAMSKEIRARVGSAQGWPALEFARFLIARPATLDTELIPRMRHLAESMITEAGAEPSGVVRRAADRFALPGVAGELATDAGITGWVTGDASWAATTCFINWLETRPGDSSCLDDARERITSIIAQKESQFQDVRQTGATKVPQNRIGWITYDRDAGEEGLSHQYEIIPAVFRDLMRGLPRNRVLKQLADAGILKTRMDGHRRRYDMRCRHGEIFETVYVVKGSIFQGSPEDYEANPPRQRKRYQDGGTDF